MNLVTAHQGDLECARVRVYFLACDVESMEDHCARDRVLNLNGLRRPSLFSGDERIISP